jgi:O-antigen/teichoic acid export membrane protein
MTLSLRKIGGNALSILTSDVMNRATSFVLYALVARHLGAYEFGQLSLALTLFYVFQVFAVAGLKTFITREVAKDRAQTGKYFINGCMGAGLTSFSSLLVLFAFVRLMHYPQDSSRVILLLSVGLFPYAFSAVCEGIFQAWEQMRFIAYINVPVNAAKIAAAFLLLSKRPELDVVVLIVLASLAAIAGIEACIVVLRFPWKASFEPRFSLGVVRSASPFLGIDSFSAIIASLNIVFLSKLRNETEVGLFSAAMQLMTPLLLVYQSFALSVFPMMCRKIEPGLQSLRQITENAIELLLVLALPAVAGIYFLGDWALSVLYRSPVFLQAFPALRIITWSLIVRVFVAVFGQALVASHREKINLRIVAVNTVVSVLVGWPLISHFGLSGAAIAVLLTSMADFAQHYLAVSRLLPGIPLAKLVWKPALAGACMAVYLAVSAGRAVILTGVSATLIYAGALLALVIAASGGPRQFRDRYLLLLSE